MVPWRLKSEDRFVRWFIRLHFLLHTILNDDPHLSRCFLKEPWCSIAHPTFPHLSISVFRVVWLIAAKSVTIKSKLFFLSKIYFVMENRSFYLALSRTIKSIPEAVIKCFRLERGVYFYCAREPRNNKSLIRLFEHNGFCVGQPGKIGFNACS